MYSNLLVIQVVFGRYNFFPTTNWQVDQMINQYKCGIITMESVFELKTVIQVMFIRSK